MRVPAATHALTVTATSYPPVHVEDVSVLEGHTSSLVITLVAEGTPAEAAARLPRTPTPAASGAVVEGSSLSDPGARPPGAVCPLGG